MARVIVLQDSFDRGMIRDLPIDHLPKGACHDVCDMIPGLKGGITMRNQWVQHAGSIGNTYCAAIGYANFAAGSQIVAITNTGALKQVSVTSTTVTARGTAQVPFMSPTFYREKVYIPSDDGTTTVKSYDGSSNAVAASGSPPAGMFATVWQDHLVLARSATNANRVWFSNGGDAGTWDTAVDGQWLDTSFVPTGLVAINNMLLVISEGAIERITGDIIPGVINSDVAVQTVFNIGASDPASIAVDGDYMVFANSNGVYMTDGIARPIDLTEQCGIRTYYRDTFSGLYGPTANLTGGIYQGYYLLAGSVGGAMGGTLCFDIARRRVWRFTNINASMMVSVPNTSDARSGDLLFAERERDSIGRLGNMFFVDGFGYSVSSAADANSVNASPSFTTGFIRGLPGLKRWRKLFVNYVLRNDTGGSVGTVTIYSNPELDGGFGGDDSNLPETGEGNQNLTRLPLRFSRLPSDGIAVKIVVSSVDNAENFKVYGIEAEVRPLEQSRA